MKVSIPAVVVAIISFTLPACQMHKEEEAHHEQNKIIVTTPDAKDVTVTQPYVCRIRSQRHIEVKALQEGYLEEIPIKEGQAVQYGEVMFRVIPAVYKAKWDAEKAEAQVAYIEWVNTKKLADADRPVVSQQEVALYKAKLERAEARAAQAE